MSASVVVQCGIMRHAIYRNEGATRLLLHIMLMIAEEEAAYNGQENREIGVLERSVKDIALTLRWHRSKVVRALGALREADAVRTSAVPGGTRIKCLYYSRPPAPEPKAPKKRQAPSAPKATIEERTAAFTAACKAVVDAEPDRLPEALRKEFHAYWTEQSASGRMRFEAQKFFDHARRMDTWRRNAEARGFGPRSSGTASTGKWNPRL